MRPLLCAVPLGFCLLAGRVGAQQYDIRVFGVEDGLPGSTVTAIGQDSSGFLWVETDGGTCRFDGKTFRTQEGTLWPGPRIDQRELSTAKGEYWSIVSGGGIDRSWNGRTRHLSHINGLGTDDLTCVFQDVSGTIWIGTRQSGLVRFTSDAVGCYSESNGLPSSQVRSITRMNGSIAIGTTRGTAIIDSAAAVSARPLTTIGAPDALPIPLSSTMFNAMLITPEGHIWRAWYNGVTVTGPGGPIRVGQDTLEATALAIAGDSTLIGTHHGLYRAPLDNSAANWTHVIRAGEEDITSLACDRAGNIWIGTALSGVLRFNKRIRQRWTTKDQLASDRVRYLLLDAYQNLWVGTDRGSNLLELDELQEEVINIRYYGLEDGFPGIEATPNACLLDTDSTLWFGTTRGVIHFDPRRVFVDPIAPRTRITDIALFYEHPDWKPWSDSLSAEGLPMGLHLPYNKNHLTFTFTGLSLAYPEKVRFQYKLEGRDADWSPITKEDRVTFSGLEPGDYVFLVKARNGSGVWNDVPAQFTFAITPPIWKTTGFRIIGGGALLLAFFGLQYLRDRRSRLAREKLERMVVDRTRELSDEKHRSDTLLLNILPETTAAELKEFGTAQARSYTECTVLFSDFQGFTVLSEQLEATGIVTELDRFFRAFDRITDKYGTEKIKTIGDAYMCASGVPEPSPTHALDAALMALEMLTVVDAINALRVREGHPAWPIRIGLHSGPLIAGVVGEKKFAYDVWGSTVNLASRMESNGASGKINISGATYALIRDQVRCTARGNIDVKGKGPMEMYFVDGLA